MEFRSRIILIVVCLLAFVSMPANSEVASSQDDTTSADISTNSLAAGTSSDVPGDKKIKDPKDEKKGSGGEVSSMSLSSPAGSGSLGGNAFNLPSVTNSTFTGAATSSIPIDVPPGRNGMAPNLSLTYLSQRGNGWVGVGWNVDMGAIQRSTKFGVDYSKNDFVAVANGSTTELVAVGGNYYVAMIEGAFLRYFYNTSECRWEVTAKNGTKYYYGSTSASRQDNNSVITIFKWCLDRVEDTNGNYMTVSYFKDPVLGEIYLDRIDYTGNSGLSPANYVKFWRELRDDAPDMYGPNFRVRTAYRLKTIEVQANGQLARAYKLNYTPSGTTQRSVLTQFQLFGDNTQITPNGDIFSGTMMPVFTAGYDPGGTGLAHPPDQFSHPALPDNLAFPTYGAPGNMFTGDFNGDGKTDYAWFPNGLQDLYIAYGTDNGFIIPTQPALRDNAALHAYGAAGFMFTGDFNGDGKTDYAWFPYGLQGLYIAYGTDNGFATPTQAALPANPALPSYGAAGFMFTGDFNGDGKTDYAWFPYGLQGLYIVYGTDNGLTTPTQAALPANPALPSYGGAGYMFTGDFNGDGKSDYAWFPYGLQSLYIAYGTDNGLIIPTQPALTANINYPYPVLGREGYMFLGDYNGDGKTDYAWFPNGYQRMYIVYGTGNGLTIPDFDHPAFDESHGYAAFGAQGFMFTGDFSGDGKTDYTWFPYPQQMLLIAYSTGSGFIYPLLSDPALPNTLGYPVYGRDGYMFLGDFNGDAKTDYAWFPYGYQRLLIAPANNVGHLPDLLTSLTNVHSGTTTIEYTPSTKFTNTLLPFPVYVVKSITANDNNGNISVTSYSYSGGYYDIKERDFRGFGYVKQINPDLTTVETWFHQDNVFKGLIEQQEVKNPGDLHPLYTLTANSYQASLPYAGCAFPHLSQTDQFLYDGTPSYKHFASSFEYDAYGNITRKYNHGDMAIIGDERDDRIEYYNDTTKWIVSQPSRTYVVIDNNINNRAADSWFTYDSANGNLLTKTDWLFGGSNPVTRFAYNSYGNRITTTDPDNNVTTVISFDSTYTYPTSIRNALYQVASKTYDARYGVPLTETDINENLTTYQYDVFGRPKKAIRPYDEGSTEGTQTIYYENFGLGTGYQRVATHSTEQSGTGNYIWNENYFDGFGRTIKTRSEGPDGKIIVTQTVYDAMGRVSDSSLPYFEGLETPRWVSYDYDPMGRVTMVTNPDNTYATKGYLLGTTISIDANGHKKEADSDAYGRLRQVREYTGVDPIFSLYATTSYNYDVLGNLTSVTDTASHETTIGYNTLSRKTSMTDPDMGYWMYQYDANGNLRFQTDAKYQTIEFIYDALNRLTTKRYPTGPEVTYAYDETFSTYPKGRLTTVSDLSGTTKFYYDKLGRTTKTIKTVDSVGYTTESTYDSLGRTTSVIYPDTGRETVSYTYDTGGNLSTVGGYATYSNYNALGQAGLVTYGNNATTIYQFYPANNRLFSITTNSQGQGRQNLAYAYDNVGNVQTITDLLDATRTQGFVYDDLNRNHQAQSTSYGTITYNIDPIGNITYNSQVGSYTYSPTKPHAVVQAGAYTYSYDANGNMTGRLAGTLTYDYENRLSSLTNGGSTTSFVYDASGGRVKKTTPSSTTVYIGNLYECTSGVCTKHIFAGGNRIVSKFPSATYYYHTDHLRSSSVITDVSGTKVEEIYYFPFGGTRLNSGSVNLKHKYTGQEEDAETGLYYYGARYYDPAIGRFVSPDTIVPNFGDPQDLNRYTYAGNNPILYADPTGHFKLKDFFKVVTSAAVGGAVFFLTGGSGAPFISAQFFASSVAAGAAGGATHAGLSGQGLSGMAQGAIKGAALGAAGAGAIMLVGPIPVLVAGAGYATATGGLDGLAYFAGGVLGGYIGYSGVEYVKNNWSNWFPTEQNPNVSQAKAGGNLGVDHSNMRAPSEPGGIGSYIDNPGDLYTGEPIKLAASFIDEKSYGWDSYTGKPQHNVLHAGSYDPTYNAEPKFAYPGAKPPLTPGTFRGLQGPPVNTYRYQPPYDSSTGGARFLPKHTAEP